MKYTDKQIEEAALASIEKQYDNAFEKMRPFSSEMESANGFNNGFKEGAKWVQEQSQWISVKDRLPEKNNTDEVLCFLVNRLNEFDVHQTIGNFNPSTNKWWLEYKSSGNHYEVTHWQPLPAPPCQ